MFENMNPLDRPTAYLEITILLTITFILGYVCARISIGSSSKKGFNNNIVKPKPQITEEITNEIEDTDPRDIITEPTEIKAILTRDRKGNLINDLKSD